MKINDNKLNSDLENREKSNVKYDNEFILNGENVYLQKNASLENKKKLITNDYKNYLNHKLNVIRQNSVNLEKDPIMIYFEKLFDKIEEMRYKPDEKGFDLQEDTSYHIEKITILIHLHGKEFEDYPDLKGKTAGQIDYIIDKEKKLLELYFDHEHPPCFPIARGVNLGDDKIKKINNIWKDYNQIINENYKDFKLNFKNDISGYTLVLNKMYSPILLGGILGLAIGLSGMREILFGKNHYISNLLEGIYIVSKAAVPFFYIQVGVQFLTMKKLDLNLTLSKTHIYFSLVYRYLIIPGLGLVWIYIMSNFYGGIVKESKVIRITMFFPFCLPCAPSISMLVNLVGYFREETAALLIVQNFSMLVGLTVLYLVYFIVIGS